MSRGESVESSFACPGKGMAFDCCALLISEFAGDVVAAVSFVFPLDSTPITCDRGSMFAEFAGDASALIGDPFLSLHAPSNSAANTAAALA